MTADLQVYRIHTEAALRRISTEIKILIHELLQKKNDSLILASELIMIIICQKIGFYLGILSFKQKHRLYFCLFSIRRRIKKIGKESEQFFSIQ